MANILVKKVPLNFTNIWQSYLKGLLLILVFFNLLNIMTVVELAGWLLKPLYTALLKSNPYPAEIRPHVIDKI